MGEVYIAEDSRLKRRVAIKVLPAAVASDETRLARFEQEALATAALNRRELFFWERDQLMSAALARDPSIRVTSRQLLFSGSFEVDFDVAKDGRFLLIQPESAGPTLVVVPNWRTELHRLTGMK